ncbi:MAG: TetR/AcrR family transcriptional regulator [Robiginitomaculum sp.]|nr:TetR/AcrR family transcriptional regulator [Robiginitomaculum sp.]
MTSPETKPKTTRGRPTRSPEQIEDMRLRISMCALKLFQAEGYTAVSMRRLAKEVGCTVMTLYKYYNRKIDILRELWKLIFKELFEEIEAITKSETDEIARLKAICKFYVNYWLNSRDRYFLVFMSSGVSQEDVSIFVGDDALLARFDILRQSLSGALEGSISEPDLTIKSQLLLCMLNGIAHNLITINAYPWTQPDQLINEAINGLLRPDCRESL